MDDLDKLTGLAAQTDADIGKANALPPDPNEPVPVEEPDQASQIAMILMALGGAGSMRFPSLGPVYSEDACRAHGAALAPAMERLGFKINAGQTMVYLGAAGSIVMLLMQTRNAIIQDIKAERMEAAANPQPPGQNAAETGAIAGTEVAVHPQVALYKNGGS